MEQMIASLLRKFEEGRMNRRQLVQSLAAAAGAASVVGPAYGATVGATKINHISYRVADYAKTRDFYSGLLGMKVSQDNGRQAYLSFGDTFLLPRNARNGGPTPQVDHIAYTIEDWDKNRVEAELKRRGLEPRPDTENSFHVKDPRS